MGKPGVGKPGPGKASHRQASHREALLKLKSTILKLKPAILQLKSTILKLNLGACLKHISEVGILGLALNPKRWTIGRLTSRTGEGRENKKGFAAYPAAQQQHPSKTAPLISRRLHTF